jgi:hypothetical protein
MAPLPGWAPRIVAMVPHGGWQTMTFKTAHAP